MNYRIQKEDLAGTITYEYEGKLLGKDSNSITIEAFFDREDMPFQGIVLKKGDRFVERYFTDRWYNIFEIYDREDGKVKGWYCNVCKPAVIEMDVISFVDLALDLWVDKDGVQKVLDEDEFIDLNLDEETKSYALRGLKDVRDYFENKKSPA